MKDKKIKLNDFTVEFKPPPSVEEIENSINVYNHLMEWKNLIEKIRLKTKMNIQF